MISGAAPVPKLFRLLVSSALKGLIISPPEVKSCSRGARWPGGLCLGLRIQRSGVRAPLGSNRVVSLSKAHLLPKSTGDTQEVVAPSQHD